MYNLSLNGSIKETAEATYLAMRIETREIADDDGHGQCNSQHTRKCTQCTDEHAVERFRSYVTVTDCRHCHQRPPKPQRNTLELVVGIVLLSNKKKKKQRDESSVKGKINIHKSFNFPH